MRSLLYCPANTPKMMIQAGIYGANAIVFDLEDAVAPEEKDEARILLSEFLKSMDFGDAGLIVRINALDSPYWEQDLQTLIPLQRAVIRLPKIERPEEVVRADRSISSLEEESGIPAGWTKLHILLETPLGIENAFAIAAGSKRIEAIAFGAEDYCSSTGIRRTGEPYALDYVRSRIVSAAGSYGLACYDAVWGVLSDPERLEQEARRARALGFDGKSVIHPDQIEIVNSVFSCTDEELSWAKRIMDKSSNGVSEIDGRMIDAPVVAQARRILQLHSSYAEHKHNS